MKPIPTLLTIFVALALSGLDSAAHAQTTYFPTDTTINYAVSGDAVIGRDSNRAEFSPTVSLVTGGSISGTARIYNSSVFNMSDGSLGDSLDANDTCTVNITGGSIHRSLEASENSTLTMSGGSLGGLSANISSTVNLRGGDLGLAILIANNRSRINFFGTDLAATLTDQEGNVSFYTLSGTLEDGFDLSNNILQVSDIASFTLNPAGAPVPVPEPGSLALFGGLGVIGTRLLVRKRRP